MISPDAFFAIVTGLSIAQFLSIYIYSTTVSVNYFRENNIFSLHHQSQQNSALNILNISTIIGFQLLAEIFMASNIKMKSLSGFNINKL